LIEIKLTPAPDDKFLNKKPEMRDELHDGNRGFDTHVRIVSVGVTLAIVVAWIAIAIAG
jgi:hypothetical protein